MKHRIRRQFTYYGLLFLRAFICCLPRPIYLVWGKWTGRIAYFALRKERAKTEGHLRLAFGHEKSAEEIQRIGQEVFQNLGQNLAEWLNCNKFHAGNIDSLVEIQGLDKLRQVVGKGRGAIILASHFGNWELLAVALTLKGYPGTVIGRRIYIKKVNRLLERMRKEQGLGVMYRDESPRKALRVLKENRLIGILPDQDVDSVEGIFVDFFGKPAYTPTGPASLARAARTALVPCFMIRQGKGHRLEICDPIEVDREGDKDQALRKATESWTRVLERYIRAYPGQWVWMHRRWKTQPS
jgi:Kdo2-lipid IVA lauroyltransferase/acyltransferase